MLQEGLGCYSIVKEQQQQQQQQSLKDTQMRI